METGSLIALAISSVSAIGMIATFVFNYRRDRRESTLDRTKECMQYHAPLLAAHEELKQRVNGIVVEKEAAHRVLHERVNGIEREIGEIKLLLTEIAVNVKHMMDQAKLTYQTLMKEH